MYGAAKKELKKMNKILKILLDYRGKNKEILRLKQKYIDKKPLTDLDYEYILHNYKRKKSLIVDKIVPLTKEYAYFLKEKYEKPFFVKRIYIYSIEGETPNIYHCLVKLSQKQEHYISLFIPKKHLLNDIKCGDKWKEYPLNEIELNNTLKKASDRILKPHQIDAIKFALFQKRCIIADEMGLGKTTEALAAVIASKCEKILIICPASVKTNWANEIGYFGEYDINIINGTDRNQYDLEHKFIICNYDIFDEHLHEVVYDTIIDEWTGKEKRVKSRNKQKIDKVNKKNPLLQSKFQFVIIDEAHRLSNSASKRTKSILSYLQYASPTYIIALTGTPITNRHQNYYNILKLIDADITKNWVYFMERYCGAKKMRLKTGREILKPGEDTNGDELREKTKHLYIRRLKNQIPGLPERTIIERFFSLSPKERETYNKLWGEYEKSQLDFDADKEIPKSLVEGWLYRQFLSKCMVKHTIELADEWISANSKVVIMAWYLDEVELFANYYKDRCVCYTGKMTAKQKDKAQEEFVNNPKIDVFIGNIIAAGVGINLVSKVENRPSDVLIMNSFDYVPGNNTQALDRIYRLNTPWDIKSYFMIFKDTHCEYIWNQVIKKTVVIDNVIVPV